MKFGNLAGKFKIARFINVKLIHAAAKKTTNNGLGNT